jgi:formylglycine-generating enzyme required for sulfatase activity
MAPKDDLERAIRESYQIIRECEDIIRTSATPDERARLRRVISEQWGLIEGYLTDYHPLVDGDLPADIDEIATLLSARTFPSTPSSSSGEECGAAGQRPAVSWKWVAGIGAVVIVVVLAVTLGGLQNKGRQTLKATMTAQAKMTRAALAATATAVQARTATVTVLAPTDTPIPDATHTSKPAPTNTALPPTSTPTPVPAAGATQVWEKDGAVMAYVPAGWFTRGSTEQDVDVVVADCGDCERDQSKGELPQHEIYLNGFWIDRTEVTNGMFMRFVDETGYETDAEKRGSSWVYTSSGWVEENGADWRRPHGPSSSIEGLENHPVVQTSWVDATAYCEWAGKRLPTEAQWEKAARGEDIRTYPWGNESSDCDKLNYGRAREPCKGGTTTAGSYLKGASPYGVLDMAGNVSEWVTDWYSESYYRHTPDRNPSGPQSGEKHPLRGGSWKDLWYKACVAYRGDGAASNFSGNTTGFRCVSPALTRVRKKDGAVMVYVPAGEFWMGSDDSDPVARSDEKPRHRVPVDAFWIDRTEVTNTQYRKCVDAGACSPPSRSRSLTRDSYYDNPEFDDYPVIFVSWDHARKYAEWVGGRLPTEAEWEYAARGPDGYIYPWGNDAPNDSLLNYAENMGNTTEVRSYPDGASWCGALDMAGNVWEWTSSLWGKDRSKPEFKYPYDPTDGRENLDAGDDVYRVVRGGSFEAPLVSARCSIRNRIYPRESIEDLGFRVYVVAQ